MKVTDGTVSSEMTRLARARQQAQMTGRAPEQSERKDTQAAARQDSVTVSVHSKDELPKVERLRVEVLEGTYRPDPSVVAERMLAEEPELDVMLPLK